MNITHLDDLVYDYTQIAFESDRIMSMNVAREIKPRLQRAADDILFIGERLNHVRERLPHGNWRPWLETEFQMSDQTARNFIHIWERLSDKSKIILNLGPTALYALAAPSTPDDAITQVEALITNGHTPTVAETKQIITTVRAGLVPAPAVTSSRDKLLDAAHAGQTLDQPAETWRDIVLAPPLSPAHPLTPSPAPSPTDNKALSPETPRDRRIAQAQSLPATTYNVVLADPPWQYNNTGVNGAAANHYNTMSFSQLSALPDQIGLDIAPNAVLFLWATNPMLADALDLVHNWGFTYKTNMVWVKDRVGTGFYVRGMHELLLICTKGAMTPINPNSTPPITSVINAPTQEHSRKPDQVHQLIEQLYPDCNYIELFARRQRAGWDVWGNEVNQ